MNNVVVTPFDVKLMNLTMAVLVLAFAVLCAVAAVRL